MQLPFPLTLALNALFKQVIRSKPEAAEVLRAGPGGLIAIELQNPAVSIRLLLQADGVELLSVYSDAPDLCLSGDVAALMALADRGHDPLLDGRVSAEGDLALAEVLQRLMVALKSDWEEQLAPFLGDTVAHKLGAVSRGFSAWLAESQQRGGEDVGEYLQEEVRVLVTAAEWQDLEADTDALREQLDRLQARVRQVEP